MKFTDLLGNSTEDRDDTAPAPSAEPATDATLTRPADIPPLVEQPVRFSRVPQPTMPPVPPYDDLLPTAGGTEADVEEAPAADDADDTDFADVEQPAPDPQPDPVAADVEWPTPDPEPEITWSPPTIERVTPAPEVDGAPGTEPEPEPAPQPVPETLPEPVAPEAVTGEPASAEEPPDPPLGPAPTAASVFGGQRTSGFTSGSAPATDDDEEPNDDAMRIARFDAIDDDLLPVARRRTRR